MEYTNKNWPKEPTKFDIDRMEKAVAKRARKGQKLMGGSLSGARGVNPDDRCVESQTQ